MKILHIIPSLTYSGTCRQLALLCRGLPPGQFDTRICVLGNDASGAGLVSQPVHLLGKSRPLDLVALWKLRRQVRSFQPHVIHAWSPLAVRNLALVGRGNSRLLVAAPLALNPLKTLDRWILGRADRIAVRGQAEAQRCALAGLPEGNIAVIPPCIGQDFFDQQMASASPLVLCAGKLEPHKGYRDAIWSLDILRFLFPDIHLALAGDGPDRTRLKYFADKNQISQRVSFLGPREDMALLISRAAVVWVPSLTDAGVQMALEAMAAGKPVIASKVPSLREIISDGRTGFLIPPGDKVALARRTCELFRNPDLARRMGEAARCHALEFSAAKFVMRTMNLYQELAPHADMWRRKVKGKVFHWRLEKAATDELLEAEEEMDRQADWSQATTSRG